jgi:hypothetical protein
VSTVDRDAELARIADLGAARGRELLAERPLTPEQTARFSLLIWPPTPATLVTTRRAS